jgi:two-component system response regulator FlrC
MHYHIPVIVVHPDPAYCKRVEQILNDLPCRVSFKTHEQAGTAPLTALDCRILVVYDDWMAPQGRVKVAKHAETDPVTVILISDYGDMRKAVKAIQNGAHDYFTKNSDDQVLRESLAGAVKNLSPEKCHSGHGQKMGPAHAIITHSEKMNQVINVAKRVSASRATVLIQGESGTGKELFARFIHRHSGRQKKAFVATNCAALPDNLAESELFGYEKGAFTGADQKRMGKFEQAGGGTLVLDEISEMPLSLQAKLLRVLQEKEVDPVGGRKTIPVDVRVIATSNRDLAKMVKEGRFREDLYYRLRVIPLTIPPLRERREDVPLLVEHFIEKFASSCPNADIRISSETQTILTNFSWPGNVRELENTIARAVLICDGSVIRPQHLLLEHDTPAMNTRNDGPVLVGMTVKEMERRLIGQTLKQLNDNRTHAAKMLGISIRTLRNKLREYENREISTQDSAIATSG